MSLIRNRPSPFTVLPHVPTDRQPPLAAICNPFPCGGDRDPDRWPDPLPDPDPEPRPRPIFSAENAIKAAKQYVRQVGGANALDWRPFEVLEIDLRDAVQIGSGPDHTLYAIPVEQEERTDVFKQFYFLRVDPKGETQAQIAGPFDVSSVG